MIYCNCSQNSLIFLVEVIMLNNKVSFEAKILCVDDEESVLKSLQRLLKRSGHLVDIEISPMKALNLVTYNHYDIIISDMRMPEMDGAEFLAATEKFCPDSVRILLTGYSDHDSTVRAINEGKVYSYINKPWDNQQLRDLIDEALAYKVLNDKEKTNHKLLKERSKELYQVNQSLSLQVKNANKNLEQTLSILDLAEDELYQVHKTTVRVFSDIINARLGQSSSLTKLIISHAKKMSNLLGLNNAVKSDIENSALLYQLGKLSLPDCLVNKNYSDMSSDEKKVYEQYPQMGDDALMPLLHMRGVGKIIHNIKENYDGSGYPNQKQADEIPIASRVLRIIIDFFEKLNLNPDNSSGVSEYLRLKVASIYDPKIVNLFLENFYRSDEGSSEIVVSTLILDELKNGMRVAKDIFNANGMLLLAEDTIVSSHLVAALKEYEVNRGVKLHIDVSNIAS